MSTTNGAIGFNSTIASIEANVPKLGVEAWVLIVVMGFMSFITVVGNLIVLLSYYLDKNIRHPSNFFIFSLAISDLVSPFLYILSCSTKYLSNEIFIQEKRRVLSANKRLGSLF